MTMLSHTSADDVVEFVSAGDIAAAVNVASQKVLIEGLNEAMVRCRRSIHDVAEILDVEVKIAHAALSGMTDLTLTETRQLAFAVGAVVRYSVTAVEDERRRQWKRQWSESVWFPTEGFSKAERHLG